MEIRFELENGFHQVRLNETITMPLDFVSFFLLELLHYPNIR